AIKDIRKELSKKLNPDGQSRDSIIAVLECAGERAPELLKIMLKTDEVPSAEGITVEDISVLADALCEVNDFAGLAGNFARAKARITARLASPSEK
ncbi:MAG: hypothetical protein NTW04_02860, partial [Elusimicrobia bacterium]|nr:hypothetical protein [Elusimicrobiota bacterium]